MKKLIVSSLIGTSIIAVSNPLLADITISAGTILETLDTSTNDYGLEGVEQIFFQADPYIRRYKFNQDVSCNLDGKFTGETVFGHALTQKCLDLTGAFINENNDGSIDLGKDNAKIRIDSDSISVGDSQLLKTNIDGSVQIGGDANDVDILEDGITIDGSAVITKNADGTIQIGTDENDIDITSEGLAIDGDPIITKKANGELHIGKNSWITKEENGRQKVWAKDANGNSIPIDYTNGTKLLINGRDVEQSINNIGALSAALTGLPTVPTDTTLACGLGTGTHGGDFAFSGGCASKVNEKLSINYAASMTMPGQDYAGDFEDTFSARAGFIWKLGKSNKPTQISMKAKEQMEDKLNSLEEKNEKILSKNQKLENKVSTLLERLERLEKVALGESKSKDLATIKLP